MTYQDSVVSLPLASNLGGQADYPADGFESLPAGSQWENDDYTDHSSTPPTLEETPDVVDLIPNISGYAQNTNFVYDVFDMLGDMDSLYELSDPGEITRVYSLFLQLTEVLAEELTKPYLRCDGHRTRYVQGGSLQEEDDDLRPPPLLSPEKSFAEILREQPPEDFNLSHKTSTATRSWSCANTQSACRKTTFTAETPTSTKPETESKGRKTSLSSILKRLSPRNSKVLQQSSELKKAASFPSSKYKPIITAHDMDGRYGVFTAELAEQVANASPINTQQSTVPFITKEHLRLDKNPPILKEDLARLPKYFETAMPTSANVFDTEATVNRYLIPRKPVGSGVRLI
ncbi:MAG: hypothetical protein Q9219_002111 [cf. Caloplaca sp. 3 TL-2023]